MSDLMYTKKELLSKLASLEIDITAKTLQNWTNSRLLGPACIDNNGKKMYKSTHINEAYAAFKMINGDVAFSNQMV